MIKVLNFRDEIPSGYTVINTTTSEKGWSRKLSPMLLGPVKINDKISLNVENAWQFSKVYNEHIDESNEPTTEYFIWRDLGYSDRWAHRYPMGKGSIPKYSLLNGEKLNYIEARKKIYIPLYSKAVFNTVEFAALQRLHKMKNGKIVLQDYDAYDHRELGMTWKDVINYENLKMGHAFVLAMLLEHFNR